MNPREPSRKQYTKATRSARRNGRRARGRVGISGPGWLAGLLAAFLGFLALRSAATGASGAPEDGPDKGAGEKPAPVEVDAVVRRPIVPVAPLLGAVEPRRRSVVAASIEGYVVGYPIDEGRWVKKEEVLARLRDSVLRLQLDEARAALEEIREKHRQAKLDLERARQLVEKDAVTEKAFDAAVTAEKTLSFQIPQAQARIDILEADIDKKTVTAPFDGQVVHEHTEVGQWVPRGGPVATLVDLSSVYVRVNVPERYVRFVEVGREVDVRFPAVRDEAFKGRVVSVSGEGDPAARTFPVRVEVPNEESLLRAGMSARVETPAGVARDVLVIPKDAVLMQGESTYVFVVAEGRALRRPVRLGAASGQTVEVTSGLEAGEKVVVRGNERLQPGNAVRVVGNATEEKAPGKVAR